jgi:hypothetical protein
MASQSLVNTLHTERGHFNECGVDLTIPFFFMLKLLYTKSVCWAIENRICCL